MGLITHYFTCWHSGMKEIMQGLDTRKRDLGSHFKILPTTKAYVYYMYVTLSNLLLLPLYCHL